MRKMKILLIPVALAAMVSSASAQFQISYPNYLINDYFYNPAIAGSKPYNPIRLSARRQWVGIEGAPQQHSLSFDGLLFQYRIGMGIGLLNQAMGPASLNALNYSWSYRFPFSANSMLSFGISGMVAQYVMDHRLLELEDPNDALLMEGYRRSYLPDGSAGLYLYSTPYNQHRYFLGISALHILDTQKELPWFKNQVDAPTLKRTYYAMAGYRIKLGNKLGFEPSGVFFTDNPEEPADFNYYINGRITWMDTVWIGASYRNAQSASFFLSLMLGRMNILYSYEISLGDIERYNYGTHELSLGILFRRREIKTL